MTATPPLGGETHENASSIGRSKLRTGTEPSGSGTLSQEHPADVCRPLAGQPLNAANRTRAVPVILAPRWSAGSM